MQAAVFPGQQLLPWAVGVYSPPHSSWFAHFNSHSVHFAVVQQLIKMDT